MKDDDDVSVLDGYVSRYAPITRLIPEELVDTIMLASGVLTGAPRTRGAPHLKYHWHVPTDVFLAYTFEGELSWGEDTIKLLTPAVKVTVWPENNLDLVDQIPNLEPAMVIHILGRYDEWDDLRYSAWVQESYLQTEQGKLLANKLMLAKLALDPQAEDDESA